MYRRHARAGTLRRYRRRRQKLLAQAGGFRELIMRPITKHRQRGVTLIELLTVVIVVAVLASLSIPSYRRYLLRAQRSDGTTALLRLAAAQEKHYIQYGTYVTVTTDLPKT